MCEPKLEHMMSLHLPKYGVTSGAAGVLSIPAPHRPSRPSARTSFSPTDPTPPPAWLSLSSPVSLPPLSPPHWLSLTVSSSAGMGKKDDPKLMQEWFKLVQEKNALVRYESELMIL